MKEKISETFRLVAPDPVSMNDQTTNLSVSMHLRKGYIDLSVDGWNALHFQMLQSTLEKVPDKNVI